MIKLKFIGIFVCFLTAWLWYHYIDKQPVQSAKIILSPPSYYIAFELKKGKEYKIISKEE